MDEENEIATPHWKACSSCEFLSDWEGCMADDIIISFNKYKDAVICESYEAKSK